MKLSAQEFKDKPFVIRELGRRVKILYQGHKKRLDYFWIGKVVEYRFGQLEHRVELVELK